MTEQLPLFPTPCYGKVTDSDPLAQYCVNPDHVNQSKHSAEPESDSDYSVETPDMGD